MKRKSNVQRIPTVSEVSWLLTLAHDQELLLAWKLSLHYFISAREAERLQADQILRENGEPVAFFLNPDNRSRGCGWYVPIKEHDRPLLQVLLPIQGRVFQSKDPYSRFLRLARAQGINLCSTWLRRTSLTYAMASGLYHRHVAQFAGLKPLSGPRHIYCPVSQTEARKFWALSVNPAGAAQLPRRLRRKPSVDKL